jgi:hypothetical protein
LIDFRENSEFEFFSLAIVPPISNNTIVASATCQLRLQTVLTANGQRLLSASAETSRKSKRAIGAMHGSA